MGKRPDYTRSLGAQGVQNALRILEGRWKLVILFELFGGKTLRFSELERAIPGVSQKMLIQQLRQFEQDGIVARIVHPEVPPRVEYRLTDWGQALCPALDALLMGGSGTARASRLVARRGFACDLDHSRQETAERIVLRIIPERLARGEAELAIQRQRRLEGRARSGFQADPLVVARARHA